MFIGIVAESGKWWFESKCRSWRGRKYCVFQADIDKKEYRLWISADWKEDVNIVYRFWRFIRVNEDWELEVEIEKKCRFRIRNVDYKEKEM